MEQTTKLSPLQLELLQMFKYNLPEEQLKEIKALLAEYFASNFTSEMDEFFSQKGLGEETIEKWAQEHMRTPNQ